MSANFTPDMTGYKGLSPFRFWCQKTLPLVYDDSLSYYELLCKVVSYINNLITDVSAAEENVDKLLTAYNQLQEYVNNYFDGADFQQKIDDSLDRYAEDGTLSRMVNTHVAALLPYEVGQQIGPVVDEDLGPVVDLKLPAVVESKIAAPVATQLPAVVQNQIDGVVGNQIGDVVADQIDEVVADQITDAVSPLVHDEVTGLIRPAVATELPAALQVYLPPEVQTQLPGAIGTDLETIAPPVIEDWLDAHPEATTSVPDGSISFSKLATDLQRRAGIVGTYFPSDFTNEYAWQVNQYAVYQGIVYRCIKTTTAGQAWNASEWTTANMNSDLFYMWWCLNYLSQSITTIDSSPATSAHEAGEYFIYYDGAHLYRLAKASSNIAVGDALTPNGNFIYSSVANMIADLKVEIADLKSAVNYLEDYVYTNIVNKTVVLSSNPFIALDTTLSSGKTYQINLQFKDITNNNLTKMVAIRLYVNGSSTSEYEDITFSVAYDQMQEDVVYTAVVTPSIDAAYMLIGFNSAASFSTDNVVINVNDMSDKFANKNVESIANTTFEALKKIIGFGDIHFTNGYYQKPDGTIAELASFMVSDFVPVTAGLTMTYSMHGYNNVASICIFESDQSTVTRNVHVAVESDIEGSITFVAGEAYVRFCRWNTEKGSGDTLSMQTIMDVASEIQRIDNEISDIGETQWQGKIWHCFGTSISDVAQVGKYPPYLVALSGLQFVNKAYSGGKLTEHILNMIKADATIANADLITVEGFVNDWSQQSTLGTITDTTPDTFYGAMYDAITYILSHSNATLVFITDTTGQNYNNIDLRRQAVRNGKTQNDFIQATIDMCNYMDIPVIDAGRKSCISQDTATLYLVDQIHQTEKGGEQYAQTIWAELKNIKPRIK